MRYTGSCHCGRIAFEVEGEIGQVISCNCSMCQRRGGLLWFVPREKLKLLTPEENASTYTFNKHVIKHRFCPTCGIQPYGEGVPPKGNGPLAAINVHCLDGVEPSTLSVKPFDGRSV